MSKPFKILPDMAGIYCFVAFVSLALWGGERALLDGDTFWHIKMGNVMLEGGEILTKDLFSHTAYGQPWTAHEWLSEIVMATIHRVSGLPGVVIFYCLLASLTFWILYRIARRSAGEWVAISAVSVAFMLSMTHFLARPHLFTWLFGVTAFYLLLRGGRGLFALPPLTALWANLHGGFLLCLLLQGIFLTGHLLEHRPGRNLQEVIHLWRQVRKPVLALLLSVLAVGLNPFGYDLLLFPLQVTKEIFSTGIKEWVSPDLQSLWPFRLYILLLLLLLSLRGAKISWTDRLLLLFWLNAAMTHQRNVSLAAIFLTPVLAGTLGKQLARLPRRRRPVDTDKEMPLSRWSGPLATAFSAVILTTISVSASPALKKSLFPLPERYSAEAIRYLERHRPEGNLFNEYTWGGYLLYAIDPPPKVFIDGRADMYGEKLFGDYGKIAMVEEDAEELLAEYEIGWVLFPSSHLLIRTLKSTGAWKEAYWDDRTSILVRSGTRAP